MKKNYALLLSLIFSTTLGFTQNRISQKYNQPEEQGRLSSEIKMNDASFYKKSINHKVFGDTLPGAYFDFAGGLPTGWTIVNNNSNNFQWKWDTVYNNGMFSTIVGPINSTTSSNGFMSLPSDFYNTPLPPTGAVIMDTYFQTDSIQIPPGKDSALWISYQQWFRYCCSNANRLVVQVSSDGFATFEEFDATGNVGSNFVNASLANSVANNIINISRATKGHSFFQLRFLSEGNTHYWWMIDDIAIIEGPGNDIELSNQFMEFNPSYGINPFYGRIPYDLFTPLALSATIRNNGYKPQSNSRLEIDINHTFTTSGGVGSGLVYSTSENTNPSTLLCDSVDRVTTTGNLFVPLNTGGFQVSFLGTSDSLDENQGNETATMSFLTTDSVMARDDSLLGAATGTGSYVRNNLPGGTLVGDRYATLYIIESRSGNGTHSIPTSISYRVSTDVANIGVEIVPKIWRFDENRSTLDSAFVQEIASSFIPRTVTALDTGTWMTLPIDNGPAFLNGIDSGQIAVGYEVTNITGGTNFSILNDGSSATLQPLVSTFLYFGHAPGWGWVTDNPAIRLNMSGLVTSVEDISELEKSIEISPNPSKGLFNLSFNSQNAETFNLTIRNSLMQEVYKNQLNARGSFNEQIDLSGFDKGLYLMSLENNSEIITKKLIIR